MGYFPENAVTQRTAILLRTEAEICADLPHRAALH